MITTNFSLRRGARGRRRRGKKILCDPDRLHKSALFKWANIIWSAALRSIIPDSYPSRERGINHGEKLFSSAPTHSPPRHTPSISLHHTAHPSDAVLCQVCFVVFSACPVKTQNNALCRNHFKWPGASISVIGFRSSLKGGNLRDEAVWVCECLGLLGGGGPSVCERDGNWGEVCEGAVSICFAYICRGGRRSMVDR